MKTSGGWVRAASFGVALVAAAAGDSGRAAAMDATSAGPPLTFPGTCDASAAVLAGPAGAFGVFVLANDEDNTLRAYAVDTAASPPRLAAAQPAIEGGALDAFLRTTSGREADLEGAARLGDRAYWIGSHGRNSNGTVRQERHRFFATELRAGDGGRLTVVPVGTSRDLGPALRARSPVLAEAIGDAGRHPELAPEEKGLNIEGLAAGSDGRSLLIGLRNPLDGDGRALVVPLENPAEIVESADAEPRLGEAIPIDLRRRGIRSLEWVPARRVYVVVAGPTGGDGEFDLYVWSGRREDPPEVIRGAADILRGIDRFHPEAVVIDAEGRRALVIGDDGDFPLRGDGRECKKLDMDERAFRAVLLVLE